MVRSDPTALNRMDLGPHGQGLKCSLTKYWALWFILIEYKRYSSKRGFVWIVIELLPSYFYFIFQFNSPKLNRLNRPYIVQKAKDWKKFDIYTKYCFCFQKTSNDAFKWNEIRFTDKFQARSFYSEFIIHEQMWNSFNPVAPKNDILMNLVYTKNFQKFFLNIRYISKTCRSCSVEAPFDLGPLNNVWKSN